jgi:adenylate cyclase
MLGMKNNSLKAWHFFTIIASINIGANIIIVVLGQFVLGPISLVQKEITNFISENVIPVPRNFLIFMIVYLLSFIIPLVLILIQTIPILKVLGKNPVPEHNLLLAKKKLLNLPLVHSLLGASGWVLGFAGTLFNVFLNGFEATAGQIMSVVFLQLGYALFCFVIIYYSLEYTSRKIFIPRLFPDNKLSDIKGSIFLSIKARFFILYFAICLFPVILTMIVLMGYMPLASLDVALLPSLLITAGILIVNIFITYLVADSYQNPILAMKEGAIKIKNSDFNVVIPVPSHDELGALVENLNETATELKDKEFIKDTFGKIVDPSVRDYLLAGNLELGGELKEVTVLFSDIRDFTSISEKMPPGELVSILNRYFESISSCITKHGGMVNTYIGDSIMAVFGAPLKMENHGQAAYAAAIEMIKAREALNNVFIQENIPPFRSGIGIHSGRVIAGNIGSLDRMEYTVIGDTVNTASRLETATKVLEVEILISESTKEYLDPSISLVKLNKIKVKGKEEVITVYTPEL